VAQPPAEQQEAAVSEHVGVDDPDQRRVAEREVGLDRRQRHVHDRRIEHDHELARAQHVQRQPAPVGHSGFVPPAITIQCTPNLSLTIPKLEAKKVFVSGCVTLPPSASAPKMRLACASSLAVSASETPSNLGLPLAKPSEASTCVSPMRNAACITLSPG